MRAEIGIQQSAVEAQLTLLEEVAVEGNADQRGVTFQESRQEPVHRWYPYVEGFSAPYVRYLLDRFRGVINVYDPFGGSGTTQLVAASRGIDSFYCEVNPFMAFVAETKISSGAWARANYEIF